MAQRKPAPSESFVTSGDEQERIDIILVRLGGQEDPSRFTFRRLTDSGAEGVWHSSRFSAGLNCKLPNKTLAETKSVLITHFLDGNTFQYTSLKEFFWAEVTARPRRFIRRDRAEQIRFNATVLVKRDRTNILRIMVERTLNDGTFSASVIDLMSAIYTVRWVRHPEREKLKNHYTLILQSLQQSGELTATEYGYRITPKAVTTLSQYEEDDRRHSNNHRQQVILGWLTWALVIVAIVQAIITVWSEIHPDPVPQTAARKDNTQTAIVLPFQ